MAVRMSGKTLGPTACELLHEPSGTRLRTMAPKDNGGDGSAFSPTDLCAASAAACAATVMQLHAQRSGIPLGEISFSVEKEMTSAPRRLGKLTLRFVLSTNGTDEQFASLVQAGKRCPVRLSLGEQVEIDERYERAP